MIMIAEVQILMDGNYFTSLIAVGTGTLDEKYDEKIFFYVDSMEDLKALMKEDNGEDFQVTVVYDFRDSVDP